MRTIFISKTQPKFDILQNASVLIVHGWNRVQNVTFKECSSQTSLPISSTKFNVFRKWKKSVESCSHEIKECSS